MLTIAVDAMGGDLGPRVAFRACKALLRSQPDVRILLPLEPGQQALAKKILAKFSDRIEIIGCSGHIRMSDSPKSALKQAGTSTMGVALSLHADGRADGVLSIGNTGALLMLAMKYIGTFSGIDRPALATQLPTRNKPVLMMDLGANIGMSPEDLLQLGRLASAWCMIGGESHPTIGLLNIGTEPGKGPEVVRRAGELFSTELASGYRGFIEGDHLFDGRLDAVICDGYSGNIALKTTEGLIEWLLSMMGNELRQSLALRWFIPMWKATMRRIDRQVSPARHGGAMLLGIAGHVAKTHGKSDERTFRYALEYLVRQIRTRDFRSLESAFSEYNTPVS